MKVSCIGTASAMQESEFSKKKKKILKWPCVLAQIGTTARKVWPFGLLFQVLNYGLGGQYDPHYDYDQHRHTRKFNTSGEVGYEIYGDRIATLLICVSPINQNLSAANF